MNIGSVAGQVLVLPVLLGDGLAALISLRANGRTAPAIILATNPTAPFRVRAASAGAMLIEKPLFGDELSSAIMHALEPRKAA